MLPSSSFPLLLRLPSVSSPLLLLLLSLPSPPLLLLPSLLLLLLPLLLLFSWRSPLLLSQASLALSASAFPLLLLLPLLPLSSFSSPQLAHPFPVRCVLGVSGLKRLLWLSLSFSCFGKFVFALSFLALILEVVGPTRSSLRSCSSVSR